MEWLKTFTVFFFLEIYILLNCAFFFSFSWDGKMSYFLSSTYKHYILHYIKYVTYIFVIVKKIVLYNSVTVDHIGFKLLPRTQVGQAICYSSFIEVWLTKNYIYLGWIQCFFKVYDVISSLYSLWDAYHSQVNYIPIPSVTICVCVCVCALRTLKIYTKMFANSFWI